MSPDCVALEVAKLGLSEIVQTSRYPHLGVAGIATRTLARIADLEREARKQSTAEAG